MSLALISSSIRYGTQNSLAKKESRDLIPRSKIKIVASPQNRIRSQRCQNCAQLSSITKTSLTQGFWVWLYNQCRREQVTLLQKVRQSSRRWYFKSQKRSRAILMWNWIAINPWQGRDSLRVNYPLFRLSLSMIIWTNLTRSKIPS